LLALLSNKDFTIPDGSISWLAASLAYTRGRWHGKYHSFLFQVEVKEYPLQEFFQNASSEGGFEDSQRRNAYELRLWE